jgi:hypothetical protein
MLAIFVVGTLRFVLTIAGLPNNIVRFVSMTAVIAVGIVYFAFATLSHKERLKAAYLLTIPYMLVEVAALGYTWFSGRPTIFHAPEYSFGGTPLWLHWIGHLIGGLTWEPFGVFGLMELVWAIGKRALQDRPVS